MFLDGGLDFENPSKKIWDFFSKPDCGHATHGSLGRVLDVVAVVERLVNVLYSLRINVEVGHKRLGL